MDSPPTSDRLLFRDASWKLIEAPAEWSVARVEIVAPIDDWERVRLWLQDQPLDVGLRKVPTGAGSEARIIADLPRLGPGAYRFRLQVGDGERQVHEVRIQPGKISQDALERMVEDLEQRLPASVALALQRFGALAGLQILSPQETTRHQELVRLRRAVEGTDERQGLLQILPALARDPHRVLREMETWVPRERSRRPQSARLAHALARPHNLDQDVRPLRVMDARVEHTVDVYENRLVRMCVEQVMRRLRRLSRYGSFASHDAIAHAAHDLLQRLRLGRECAPFLDEVQLPTHLPLRVTMVLLRRPAYHAALQGYLEVHRSVSVRIEEPFLETPLENLPRLYQVWGVLQVLDILLDVATDHGYQLTYNNLLHRDTEGFYVRILPKGFTALRLVHPLHNVQVRAIAEPTFSSSSHPLHSISFEQRPDLSIEIHHANGSIDVYLFDPKYKLDSELADGQLVSRPQKVDIDKMHAYRDAIRDRDGRRVVRYAAILYPGQTEGYPQPGASPRIQALRAYPGDDAELRQCLSIVLHGALEQAREAKVPG